MAFEKNMSENYEQLNLDVGSIFLPKTISNILTEVSMVDEFSQKSSKLDFYVHLLEEEMRKIDAFKRELPHCMHLLKDAIETLKKEKLQLKGREKGPVMEELIPLKSDSEGEGRAKPSNDISEKKNWMSSVQLWSTPVQYENNFDTRNHCSVLSLKSRHEEEEQASVYESNFSKRGGAFVPFKKASMMKEDRRAVPVPVPVPVEGLSLSIPVAEVESIDLSVKDASRFVRPHLQQLQQQRKQRRCWSPELHKRFVDALLQLGGAQTATPKQIRELMKVDGLTNDEVKSHLQKYRLHIRKLPSTSAGAADLSWLTHIERGDSTKRLVAHSGSPQDHLNQGGSTKVGSANGGDSMEDDEDDKSENRSSKGQFQMPVEHHA